MTSHFLAMGKDNNVDDFKDILPSGGVAMK